MKTKHFTVYKTLKIPDCHNENLMMELFQLVYHIQYKEDHTRYKDVHVAENYLNAAENCLCAAESCLYVEFSSCC